MSNYIVAASGSVELQLNETDVVKSALQNVYIILNTWKGSVPLDRVFGISDRFLHRPVNVAKSMMVGDIQEAIETYEPRVRFVSLSFETDPNNAETLRPVVEVEINEQK